MKTEKNNRCMECQKEIPTYGKICTSCRAERTTKTRLWNLSMKKRDERTCKIYNEGGNPWLQD